MTFEPLEPLSRKNLGGAYTGGSSPIGLSLPNELKGEISPETFADWRSLMEERRLLLKSLSGPIFRASEFLTQKYSELAAELRAPRTDIRDFLDGTTSELPYKQNLNSRLRTETHEAIVKLTQNVDGDLTSIWLSEGNHTLNPDSFNTDSYRVFLWSFMVMVEKGDIAGAKDEFKTPKRLASETKEYPVTMHTHVDMPYWLQRLGPVTELGLMIGNGHDTIEHGRLITPWASGVRLKEIGKGDLVKLLEAEGVNPVTARRVSVGIQALSEDKFEVIAEKILKYMGPEAIDEYRGKVEKHQKAFKRLYPSVTDQELESIFVRGPLVFGALALQEYYVINSLKRRAESEDALPKDTTPEDLVILAEEIFKNSVADRLSDVAFVRRYVLKFSEEPSKARPMIVANLSRQVFFSNQLEKSINSLASSKVRPFDVSSSLRLAHELGPKSPIRGLSFVDDFIVIRLADANEGLRARGQEPISVKEYGEVYEDIFSDVYEEAADLVGPYASDEARRIVETLYS